MDWVYLAGSLLGVALIVGLNVLLLGRASAKLDGLAPAKARLAAEVPGFTAGAAALSGDGTSALIENAQDGALWLVAAKGDGLVTRNLTRDGLTGVSRAGKSLTLSLSDFTLPRAKVPLQDEASAREWARRLGYTG